MSFYLISELNFYFFHPVTYLRDDWNILRSFGQIIRRSTSSRLNSSKLNQSDRSFIPPLEVLPFVREPYSRDTYANSAFIAGIRACLRDGRRHGLALSHETAIIKPLTLLYRVINLNITTRVSRSFGPADLSQQGFRDVTERRGLSPIE